MRQQKVVSDNGLTPTPTHSSASKHEKAEQTAFVHRVAEGAVTAKNIVASAEFRLIAGGKSDLTCDGKFSMRRDEIIRLQMLIPIIRSEIARIDFTPDYVLLVDRYHKEYIKASYKEVSFLADNGIRSIRCRLSSGTNCSCRARRPSTSRCSRSLCVALCPLPPPCP